MTDAVGITVRILPPEEGIKLAGTELEGFGALMAPDRAEIVVLERDGRIVACVAGFWCLRWEGLWLAPEVRSQREAVERLYSAMCHLAVTQGARGVLADATATRGGIRGSRPVLRSATEGGVSMDITQDTLEHLFSYHAPPGDQVERSQVIRKSGPVFAANRLDLVPPSRKRSLALTKIEEAVMSANAAMAINEREAREEHERTAAVRARITAFEAGVDWARGVSRTVYAGSCGFEAATLGALKVHLAQHGARRVFVRPAWQEGDDMAVRDEWDDYRARVLPEDATQAQVQECRRAFYAGAAAMFRMVQAIAVYEPNDDAGGRKLMAIREELARFAAPPIEIDAQAGPDGRLELRLREPGGSS